MPASLEQKRLLGKVHLKCILFVETGLHIGGGEGSLDIGGIDKLVVREPITQHPYLPGSSIKGKLRSILERYLNKPLNREAGQDIWRYESDDIVNGYTEIKQSNGRERLLIFYEGAQTCKLSRVFGSTGKDCWIKVTDAEGLPRMEQQPRGIVKVGREGRFQDEGEAHVKIKGRNAPARLIVRDSHLQKASIKQLEKVDTGLFMTERKFENGLDRITAAANPRQIERVPKGARFDLEMVYTVEKTEDVKDDLENLAIALAILEDDALGGHGSRGYGKVRFEKFQLFCHDYSKVAGGGKDFITPIATPENITELLALFDGKDDKVQKALPAKAEKS